MVVITRGILLATIRSESQSDDTPWPDDSANEITYRAIASLSFLGGQVLGIKPGVFNQCSLCQNSAKTCQNQIS